MYRAFDNGDGDMQAILAKYEIHILPLVNPDGYEYSHTTVNFVIFNEIIFFKFHLIKNRMWRKNRRPNTGSSCVGTDLNRNFGFQWMVSLKLKATFFFLFQIFEIIAKFYNAF